MVHTNNGTYTCLHNPWLLNISGHLLKSRMTGNVENEQIFGFFSFKWFFLIILIVVQIYTGCFYQFTYSSHLRYLKV